MGMESVMVMATVMVMGRVSVELHRNGDDDDFHGEDGHGASDCGVEDSVGDGEIDS